MYESMLKTLYKVKMLGLWSFPWPLGGLPVVKRLSDIRWATHCNASKSLNSGYENIRMVLEQFTENLDETVKSRQHARCILSKLNTLENYI